MSRRRSDGEQEFGSDSFLDVIANIVGILIILIVVAGVKVARQADVSPLEIAEAVAAEVAAKQITENATTETSPTAWPWAVAATDKLDLAIPDFADTSSGPFDVSKDAFDFSPNSDAQPEIAEAVEQQLAKLSLELAQTQQFTAESEAELHQLMAALQQQENGARLQVARLNSIGQEQTRLMASVLELQESGIKVDTQSDSFGSTLASLQKRQTYVQNALKQVSFDTLRLREVLDSQEQNEQSGDRLNHRLSPVGRTVSSEEDQLHFRLHSGRIAHVPLKALVDRAGEQSQRRGNLIGRVPRYQGVVGPVEGFRLEYTIVRRLRSPTEISRSGQPYELYTEDVKISPAENLQAETVDQALRLGSRFRQLLESSPRDTTVSIWLYPNEFKYFSRLRDFAHTLDLRVAAWPQRDGEPIGLNLNGGGSRSVAQ
jgi:hypothetical protein